MGKQSILFSLFLAPLKPYYGLHFIMIGAIIALGGSLAIPEPITISAEQQQQTPTPLNGTEKIVVLGDSITQAGGQYGGYVWLLRQYLTTLYPQQSIEIIPSGVSGNKSLDLEARFNQDVLSQKPDLVIINVGINDVMQSFNSSSSEEKDVSPLDIYRQKLNAMVKSARARNMQVMLLSPTIIYEDLNSRENIRMVEYINAMRDVAAQNQAQFLDLHTPFRHIIMTYQRYGGRSQNILTRDGIHPNLAGHQIMTYTLLRGLGVPEADIEDLKFQ